MIETPTYGLTVFKVHFGPCHPEGVLQGRARAALRGHRPQHPPAPPRQRPRALPRDRRPADRDARPLHDDARLRRRRLLVRRDLGRAPSVLSPRRDTRRRHRPQQASVPGRARRRSSPSPLHRKCFTVAGARREGPLDDRARPTTAPARPPTTSASSARKDSLPNRSISPLSRSAGGSRARSPRSASFASTWSAPSSPVSEVPVRGASPPPGRESTATTSPSALACRPSSATSASHDRCSRHRQLFVDLSPQGSSRLCPADGPRGPQWPRRAPGGCRSRCPRTGRA